MLYAVCDVCVVMLCLFVESMCLVFAYVNLDQLKLCVVCIDGLGYVCECYVILDFFVCVVCAYGGVV